MAKAAAPSQDQLLELMKRAAEELKHAQEEARTAVMALQKEQARDAGGGESSEEDTEDQGQLDDAGGKLVEMETSLTQARDKHQATAQKRIESKSKAREREASLQAEHERVKGLETSAKQLAD